VWLKRMLLTLPMLALPRALSSGIPGLSARLLGLLQVHLSLCVHHLILPGPSTVRFLIGAFAFGNKL